MGPLRLKRDFLPFFKSSTYQGLKSPIGFWLGLLAAWVFYFTDPSFQLRSYSKPPVLSSKPPGLKFIAAIVKMKIHEMHEVVPFLISCHMIL